MGRHIVSRQDVIEAIRGRHRTGLPLQNIRRHDRALYLASRRHFTRWSDAIAAAGLQLPQRQQWSNQRILDEIRVWHQENPPVSRIRLENRLLYAAAIKRLGRWADAFRAAGGSGWPRQAVVLRSLACG